MTRNLASDSLSPLKGAVAAPLWVLPETRRGGHFRALNHHRSQDTVEDEWGSIYTEEGSLPVVRGESDKQGRRESGSQIESEAASRAALTSASFIFCLEKKKKSIFVHSRLA